MSSGAEMSNGPETKSIYGGYTATNYIAVHAGGVLEVSDSADDPGNGMFGENSFRKLNIADGLSNTLAIGERQVSPLRNQGAIWMRSSNRAFDGGDGTSVAGVCHRDIRPNDKLSPNAFTSAHPKGAMFTMGDASVRTIAADIDGTVYEQLGNAGNTKKWGESDADSNEN